MPGSLVDITIDQNMLKQLENLAGFDRVATPHLAQAMRVAVAIGERKTIAELRTVAQEQRGMMASEVGGNFEPLAPINPSIAENRIHGISETHGLMDVVGIVGDSTGKYLRMAESGRGPGKHPPAAVMQDWAERNLGVTPAPSRMTKKGKIIRDVSVGRALAHAIAQKGVKGRPIIKDVIAAINNPVNEQFQAALLRIAAELGFK
jgi:hypothetical protein